MSYFQEIDSWLDNLLFEFLSPSDSNDAWFKEIKKEISAKILESYRNGQKAGLTPAKPSADASADVRPRSNGDRNFRFRSRRGNGRQ